MESARTCLDAALGLRRALYGDQHPWTAATRQALQDLALALKQCLRCPQPLAKGCDWRREKVCVLLREAPFGSTAVGKSTPYLYRD